MLVAENFKPRVYFFIFLIGARKPPTVIISRPYRNSDKNLGKKPQIKKIFFYHDHNLALIVWVTKAAEASMRIPQDMMSSERSRDKTHAVCPHPAHKIHAVCSHPAHKTHAVCLHPVHKTQTGSPDAELKICGTHAVLVWVKGFQECWPDYTVW
jgi:hypothetical protein